MNVVFSAAALLLVAAGTLKLARPSTTAKALNVAPLAVRAGAGIEALLGLAAVTGGGWWSAVLVGASYVAFAVFVISALASGRPLATCGCFGEPDTRPTVPHVIIDLGFAVASLVAAADGEARPLLRLGAASWLGAIAVAYLAFLALSSLPRLLDEVRR